MQEQDYMTQRLDEQQSWYSTRATKNKSRYHILKVMTILLAASLPLLAGFSEQMPIFKWFIGIAGALIALIEGLQNLYKYQETWLQYRQISESLQREKILFQTGAGVYRNDKSLQMLVERVELITSAENQQWAAKFQDNDQKS